MVNIVSDNDSVASILPVSTATDNATTTSTEQETDIEVHKNLTVPVAVSQMLLDSITKEQQAAAKALIDWTIAKKDIVKKVSS